MTADEVCGFCQNGPVVDAATWLDGVPREPVPCPRCGVTYAEEAEQERDCSPHFADGCDDLDAL